MKKSIILRQEEFITKAKLVHGDKYDLSLLPEVIQNQRQKVLIRCKKHNYVFTASIHHLLEGHGCRKCASEVLARLTAKTTEEFQKELDHKFGPIYKVLTDYVNNHTKITCKCLKCGSIFTRKPSAILDGVGCLNCFSSRLEQQIDSLLTKESLPFVREKTFKWLPKKRFDFFLPDLNLVIECHGEQHFNPVPYFGGEDGLRELLESDFLKYNTCIEHSIKVLYFAEFPHDYFAPIYSNIDDVVAILDKLKT